ncbi:NAD(P) transhydrogenase subunit alpha [Devosia limi DSM 17137]|uniref:NAD(P) transhydrogenase subunit alpha n=1 Tax=Devosia limi DSM 17137 TaxID=1121477 RepID=A0A0F5LXF9_9HYPH|nr:Re/Si-specific NAD(P)(+) transhydrogenase subunit alpha [Devosia limi]KKB86337.1 NAD(P) transhydrogenase subunit alpha [Devosia limi DSM 17137]SHE93380.1 NAD(P) transhydrogenase subunit alpha [Devosia limi DSM 17137]
MKIAIVRERFDGENRVAATPETVGKLIALGADVSVEKGAGDGSRIRDEDYKAAGAAIAATAEAALKGAEVVLTVRRPSAASLAGVAKGALLIGALDPYGNDKDIAALAKAGVTAVSMEFMPRITRAQVMDILSSQANLAGYQAVIDAAAEFDRAMPMMMTAAGTVRPAKAFVMGAGVAGLQAIATAKRLGAVVSATDVRPAAKEQVESLGGKFIAVEDEEFKQAETAGGYAKQMSAEYQAKQAELTASHIAKQDIVITTALIPGRPAPRLITKAMVESMAPGSIIVDLAAERGGNVELTVPGKIVEHNGVKIIGYTNVQGRIPTTASQLYARNLLAFLTTLIDAKAKALAVNWDDELVKATVLTRDGAVVHPSFVTAAAPAAEKPAPKAAKAAPAKKAAAKPAASAAAAAEAPVAAKAAEPKAAAPKKTAVKKAAPAAAPDAAAPAAAKAAAVKAAPAKAAPAKKPAAKKPAAKPPAAPAKDTK